MMWDLGHKLDHENAQITPYHSMFYHILITVEESETIPYTSNLR